MPSMSLANKGSHNSETKPVTMSPALCIIFMFSTTEMTLHSYSRSTDTAAHVALLIL